MLAQSSDWAFILKTGTTPPYATKRTVDHVSRFNRIYDELTPKTKNGDGKPAITDAFVKFLAEAERRDNPFKDIDYSVYAS